MSPNQGSAGPRGARFQAVFARSRSAGIGWDLWGLLPHLLPQRPIAFQRAFTGFIEAFLAGFHRLSASPTLEPVFDPRA